MPNTDDRPELAALYAFNIIYTNKSICDELLRRFGSFKNAWDELLSNKAAAEGWFPHRLLRKVNGSLLDRANAELDKAVKEGVLLLPCWDPGYPHLLFSIVNPPPLLHILGNPDALNAQSVAVVGSRTSSFYGKKVAGLVASALAQKGYTVVSGFARGIDTEAHTASISREEIGLFPASPSLRLSLKPEEKAALLLLQLGPQSRDERCFRFPARLIPVIPQVAISSCVRGLHYWNLIPISRKYWGVFRGSSFKLKAKKKHLQPLLPNYRQNPFSIRVRREKSSSSIQSG